MNQDNIKPGRAGNQMWSDTDYLKINSSATKAIATPANFAADADYPLKWCQLTSGIIHIEGRLLSTSVIGAGTDFLTIPNMAANFAKPVDKVFALSLGASVVVNASSKIVGNDVVITNDDQIPDGAYVIFDLFFLPQ